MDGEQLVVYLKDAHSIEAQALVQLRAAPRIAGDGALAAAFREHLAETEGHEALVRERLQSHGATPSTARELVMRAGGEAFVLFARSQPDTPGKLAAHAFSYEHLEAAAYELLAIAAERAGDSQTADVARRILAQERAMAGRIAACFDEAVAASLRDPDQAALRRRLISYLADAHAIEQQSEQLLRRGARLAGAPQLAEALREHLGQTREQTALLEKRLSEHDSSPSRLKDAALRLGALNWSAFFAAQPDTPAKLAAFAYAVEHLEIAGYELLSRVAARAGDHASVQACSLILAQERAAAAQIASTFEAALDASPSARGVAA